MLVFRHVAVLMLTVLFPLMIKVLPSKHQSSSRIYQVRLTLWRSFTSIRWLFHNWHSGYLTGIIVKNIYLYTSHDGFSDIRQVGVDENDCVLISMSFNENHLFFILWPALHSQTTTCSHRSASFSFSRCFKVEAVEQKLFHHFYVPV